MNEFTESRFSLDFLPEKTFNGFTTGEDWNGFACPYFTFEQAQKVVSAWNESGSKAFYDEQKDAFVFEMKDADELDAYQPEEIDGRKYYPIGAQSWIWDEV